MPSLALPGIILFNHLDPLQLDAIRQVHYGDSQLTHDPLPHFSYALTYANLPLDVIFYGLEGGWKHLGANYEFSINFSYFNDKDLVDKREKGKKIFQLFKLL